MAEVKLLGFWASPFAMKPRIALHLKSVEYEYIEETIKTQTLFLKSELLLKSNPVYKKIPVLIHNDKPVCESTIIVEYIDEAFPSGPSILPSDPYDRAIHRFWANYVDDKWVQAFHEVIRSDSEEVRAAGTEKLKEGLSLLEDAFVTCSKGKSFFNGDSIGYLDIVLGSFLGWLRVSEKINNIELLNHEITPNLDAWAQRFCTNDAVKDYMHETEKLMEFAKTFLARFKAVA